MQWTPLKSTYTLLMSEISLHSHRLASLYNVLHAYSVLDKLVSYCQGMNYMVAVLLMFMEEEVSWLFFLPTSTYVYFPAIRMHFGCL
jgi:hypothetical protein